MACAICSHPDRVEIERTIRNGLSYRRTARKYGLSDHNIVAKHKKICMPGAPVVPISSYPGEENDVPVRRTRRAPLITKQIDLSGKSAKERLETLLELTVGLVNEGPEFSRLEALKQAKALILDIDSIDKVEQPATQKGPDASALTASILDKLDKLHGSASQSDAEPTPLPSESAAPAVH
ncbi:hypothetical protein BE20_24985 [Sorangium cellulosum]|uniref:Uncharacterized protein n=1 Tax=Sorangium cellulosum TaxID=56 RepID=A0A150S5R9_SORCE|nr:hypothetical protein BE20_24985 [Sorangium cellulosum]KYF89262.1 hypothetical protein BE18_22785 [Sorangium cellulosum]